MNWNDAIKELDSRRQRALAGGGQGKIDKRHEDGAVNIAFKRKIKARKIRQPCVRSVRPSTRSVF